MLIDRLTERLCFSELDAVLSGILYATAALAALLLRRWGQARTADKRCRGLSATLLRDIPGGLWSVFFFVLTGCLKGPVREEDKTNDAHKNRSIFLGGICYTVIGAIGSFFLYTLLQFLAARVGGIGWQIPLLAAKALTGANLSLLWFSLLPLPGSDAEVFLRTKGFGNKGEALRKNGTWPFFIFCTLALLLACITIPLPDGRFCSLSGIITLFPVLLIGG